ncbi:Predicted arabinose efflux permease, MFS family [Rhizobiales bacterium GAS113]|nr:Predicted arabinose efflux permease, MFS family [Rhizobiales bacterium GAS113]
MRLQGSGVSAANAADTGASASSHRDRRIVVTAVGVTQIFAWGSSYYLPAVLAKPIAAETGWSLTFVIGGLSLGLVVAGLASPMVGRTIERLGGRPVLAISAVLLAIGLLILSVAGSLLVYLGAWLVLGLGMGAGLYDPAFATLGRLYGQAARPAITAVTLFGGFASTVCWPLSAFLEAKLGWRETCVIYAMLQLLMALPAHIWALPREESAKGLGPGNAGAAAPVADGRSGVGIFVLLATVITLGSVLSTVISVHLLAVLQARGIALAAAVGLGALVGPSQVGARTIEMFVARFHHPIWTKLVSTFCVALGLLLLWNGIPIISIALVFYGAGIGLESIARGTLPLAIFGAAHYPAIMGRIARPSLLAQAAAPTIAAALIEAVGIDGMLAALVFAAIGNTVLTALLFLLLRSRFPPFP